MNSACHYARTFDDYLAREFRKILSREKQMPEEEPFSPDQIEGLVLWLDASDKSTIQLTYSADALGGATASGTNGTNTITTSADVSADLAVGLRIRLGAAGTVSMADTLGTDTYTVTNIAGTTITVAEALIANYSSVALYRGLVSQWSDKAGTNHAVQATASKMPLWVSNGQNNVDTLYFDGASDEFALLSNPTVANGLSVFSTTFIVSTPGNGNPNIIDNWDWPNNKRSWSFGTEGNKAAMSVSRDGSFGNRIAAISAANIPVGSSKILSGVFDGQNINMYQDGAVIGSASYGTPQSIFTDASTQTLIGRSHGNEGGGFRHLEAKIGEIFLFNAGLDDNSRQLVEQYQAAKWGIALDPVA